MPSFGADRFDEIRQEIQQLKDSIVRTFQGWMAMVKDGEKQMHGVYAGHATLPTQIEMAIADLEQAYEAAEDHPRLQRMYRRRINKLRRHASTFSPYPRALIDIVTNPEERKMQEVIPPVTSDFGPDEFMEMLKTLGAEEEA